jgi:hypothetical protein
VPKNRRKINFFILPAEGIIGCFSWARGPRGTVNFPGPPVHLEVGEASAGLGRNMAGNFSISGFRLSGRHFAEMAKMTNV